MAGGGGGEGSAWVWVLVAGVVLCGAGHGIDLGGFELPWVMAGCKALGGLAVVFGSCEAMIAAPMRPLTILVVLACAPLAHAQDETRGREAVAQDSVPEPPGPVELRPATVRFAANVEGLRVHYLADPVLDDDGGGGLVVRVAAEPRYATLCDAPCDRELPQGHFGLAVSRGDRMIRLLEPLGIDGPTGVRLRWEDRGDLRLAGILTLAIGIPIGLGVAIVPLAAEASASGVGDASVVGLVVGGVLVGASLTIGLLLALSDDGVSFSVSPLPTEANGLFSDEW